MKNFPLNSLVIISPKQNNKVRRGRIKISNTHSRTPYYMVRRTKISPTGYILQMPINIRRHLIQEINNLITSLLESHVYPYFIEKSFKKSYEGINKELRRLSNIHRMLKLVDCVELFLVMLGIYDYISAQSQSDIARKCIRYKGFIKDLAKLSLQDPNEYKNRFPGTKHFKNRILNIANNVIAGNIKYDNISNIDSFEFQQIIRAYRKDEVLFKTDLLLKKGYPSVGSSKFKDRVRDFQRKDLFDRNFLGLNFIRWVEDLTDSELKGIIKPIDKNRRDILKMCNEINQNHEIFKYIVYLILTTQDSLRRIVKKSGKNNHTIRRIAKILDLNINPITNNYFINYETRFLS